MGYSKKDFKYYYVDLNVIYVFFDYLTPKNMEIDTKERRECLTKFILENSKIKFIISKTVYIEWFQRVLNSHLNKDLTFSKFIKKEEYIKIIEKFESAHKRIIDKKSIFEFEWKFLKFIHPWKDSWDHFHESFKEKKNVKFITFDKEFTKNKSDFIYLDRNKKQI